MEKDNNIETKGLNKYQKILFWIIFIISALSISSYLLNPYVPMIKEFKIDINQIYLLLILIVISSLTILKKIKWGDKEFEFDKTTIKEEVRGLNNISSKISPMRLPKKIQSQITKFEESKDYVEGLIYFFNEIEKAIKNNLKEPISSSNFTVIINQAFQEGLINEYDYYDIIRLNNVRNVLIHHLDYKINEIDLIKILYLSADVYCRIGGIKNEKLEKKIRNIKNFT